MSMSIRKKTNSLKESVVRATLLLILLIATNSVYADFNCKTDVLGLAESMEFRSNEDGTTTLIMSAMNQSTPESYDNFKIIHFVANRFAVRTRTEEGRELNTIRITFPSNSCQWDRNIPLVSHCNFDKTKVMIEFWAADLGFGFNGGLEPTKLGEREGYVVFNSSINSNTFWSDELNGVVSRRSSYESSISFANLARLRQEYKADAPHRYGLQQCEPNSQTTHRSEARLQ